jgi:hypothetical protein
MLQPSAAYATGVGLPTGGAGAASRRSCGQGCRREELGLGLRREELGLAGAAGGKSACEMGGGSPSAVGQPLLITSYVYRQRDKNSENHC